MLSTTVAHGTAAMCFRPRATDRHVSIVTRCRRSKHDSAKWFRGLADLHQADHAPGPCPRASAQLLGRAVEHGRPIPASGDLVSTVHVATARRARLHFESGVSIGSAPKDVLLPLPAPLLGVQHGA